MSRLPTIIVLTLAGLCLSGCSSSLWATRRPSPVVLKTKTPRTTSQTTDTIASPASTRSDPQTMKDIMAELQQVGATDPAAQEQLMEDLRDSDPSIWPLVMQQFRATQAYRRQVMERTAVAQEEAERLPPVNDVAVAAVEVPKEPMPIFEPDEVEQTPSPVVQASYPTPETPPRSSEPTLLLVRNLAFCAEVQGYGKVKRFEKYAFQSDREILLYAEVENFVSEQSPRGYDTLLKSSYRIFDAGGRRVADHSYDATEDYCQNPRRDFFMGYRIRLPKELEPGTYRLVLSIEDLHSQKLGQAEIEFEIAK